MLAHIWGTHTLSAEGVLNARSPLDQREKPRKVDDYARDHLAALFDMAEPYFVDGGLLSVIEGNAPALLLHARLHPRLFPSRYGCLLFDRPVRGMPWRRLARPADRPDLPDTEPAPMSGFAWQVDEGGVVIVMLHSWAADEREPGNWRNGVYLGNIPLTVTPWTWTTTLGDYVAEHNTKLLSRDDGEYGPGKFDRDDDLVNAERFAMSARIAVATLLLMDQTITVHTPTPIDRAARKRAIRSGWQRETTVRVVTLRRVEQAQPGPAGPGIDWKCRWYVRQHWRTLHRYTPDERTVLVHEHLKGPPDMPLKPPGSRVFAVIR